MEAMEKKKPVLAVRNLTIDFLLENGPVNAVRDVSFEIREGETLGIVGESGCGKSMTASAVMGLLPPEAKITEGEILLEEQDLTKLSAKQLQKIRGNRISMIFQDPMTALNPVYRVKKQLAEILLAHQKMPRREAYERCLRMLEKVGIPAPAERMEKFPHELSGGMRQRVMIAMALLTNPTVLIADEPTTALDVTIQAQILQLIRQLQKDLSTAVILITHDMGVIAESADRVAVMYAGEIVEFDTAEGIFSDALHPYTQGLLRSIPRFDREMQELESIEGNVPELGNMPSGCCFANRCRRCMDICRQKKPPLAPAGRAGSGKLVRCFLCQDYENDGQASGQTRNG